MYRLVLVVLAIWVWPVLLPAQLQSPDEFLPHRLGQTFTPHHLLVDYFQHVAANSPNVELIEYGHTNEGRPLLLAFVSTPDNLARLEDLRLNNLRHTGLAEGRPSADLDRAIVWLSFSVHGNEAAGSEASMGVVYDLANPSDSRTQAWLRNTIVIIDPSLNPDGYSRYTHWYRGVANRLPNPDPLVREHNEPWPGGRVNHYLFDLNRDWAWQTQVESRQRIVQYQRWMPHIHADLHEQYYTNPYYFAPAAQPYHPYITDWQSDFQTDIGRNHARYFDRNGWFYFTREVFDLFYPSYGDTYPTFSGAIGMTYEQGGHSRAGRAINLPNGDTLTLYDRVAHHRTTALSTVEIASQEKEELLKNFHDYFARTTASPLGAYKSYVIKGDNDPARLRALMDLLDRNGIRYGHSTARSSVKGYDYATGKENTMTVDPNDLVVSAYQPLSVLTQVLFDPISELVDSLTYDITAWSLPYAYGLKAFATTSQLRLEAGYTPVASRGGLGDATPAYAYVISRGSVADSKLLGDLLTNGIRVRFAGSEFSNSGQRFPAGSLIVARGDNRANENFDRRLREIVQPYQAKITPLTTGFSDSGPDIGSSSMQLVDAPKVALVSGEQTYPNEFGQVWYFFEQRLGYPVYVIDADDLGSIQRGDYDVLILPEGNYDLSDEALRRLGDWVSGGGRLIAIGAALRSLAGQPGFALKAKNGGGETESRSPMQETYSGQERRAISGSIPGAIFKVSMDATHPLAYGIGDTYFSLKTDASAYEPLENGWNVGTLGDQLTVAGFAGSQARENLRNSLVFGVQERGAGSIVYMVDNPLFRGFWEIGNYLFSNAVFLR